LTLEDVDRDGAVHEVLADLHGETRAGILRKAALGSAALVGALALPGRAAAGPKLDTAILNYGLVFEYLQSSFYTDAQRIGTLRQMRPEVAEWARVLGAHELAHVRILEQVLGKKAAKRPFFNFRGVTEDEDNFTRTAVAMEDLTVALLTGQAPRVSSPELVSAFFSLITVEARHAAWARRLVGFRPVGPAIDEPKTLEEVDRVVRSTRFIASRPRTGRRGQPRFTG
jgi:hypothetical protein